MKRIIIICEGETEREFCQKILAPYFTGLQIYLETPLIKKSGGGIVKWTELKKQIVGHLKSDFNAYVTTFIDYYGLNDKLAFPKWEEAEREPNKSERMDILEKGMFESIEEVNNSRFIPYVQLHEFEALLFTEIEVFYEQIPEDELVGIEELKETFDIFDNPELINNSKTTSPSHRLERIINGYNKVVYGNILAEAIGLEKIKNKNPRFKTWINKIENTVII